MSVRLCACQTAQFGSVRCVSGRMLIHATIRLQRESADYYRLAGSCSITYDIIHAVLIGMYTTACICTCCDFFRGSRGSLQTTLSNSTSMAFNYELVGHFKIYYIIMYVQNYWHYYSLSVKLTGMACVYTLSLTVFICGLSLTLYQYHGILLVSTVVSISFSRA